MLPSEAGICHTVTLTGATAALELIRPMLEGRLLLATDFDGTISSLVLDPWRARIIPAAQRALRKLASAPETHVAFISGRVVCDLAPRVAVGGASYHGDHGAEVAHAGRGFRPAALRVTREPVAPEVRRMADRLKVEVPQRVPEPWLVVEDKGPAVTFHFRGAPNVEVARAQVRAAVDAIDPDGLLDQPGGRRAWELRPHGATTKAVALARLIERHGPDVVCFLGDDRHDALAFEALRSAREQGSVRGLACGVISPAAGAEETARQADLVFGNAGEAARFLVLLARERVGV